MLLLASCWEKTEYLFEQGSCETDSEGSYKDPLNRTQLSILVCRSPDGLSTLFIVTDPSISWPVLKVGEVLISYENSVLEQDSGGLMFFNENSDYMVWFQKSDLLAAISLTDSGEQIGKSKAKWFGINKSETKLVLESRELRHLEKK